MRESRDAVEDVRAEACDSDCEYYGNGATARHGMQA
jgi:hypothetical protein